MFLYSSSVSFTSERFVVIVRSFVAIVDCVFLVERFFLWRRDEKKREKSADVQYLI